MCIVNSGNVNVCMKIFEKLETFYVCIEGHKKGRYISDGVAFIVVSLLEKELKCIFQFADNRFNKIKCFMYTQ